MSTLHVVFKVGEAEYAVAASQVVQMESYNGATQVPGAAPYVAGIVQVRGRVVPVVDLRVRFGLPPIERSLASRIVVVQEQGRHVGLLADAAREVTRIDEESFLPPPDIVAQQAAGFVSAVAQAGERMLLRLDVARVIADDRGTEENSDAQGEN